MSEANDTPKTDAAVYTYEQQYKDGYITESAVDPNFARELERENARLQAELSARTAGEVKLTRREKAAALAAIGFAQAGEDPFEGQRQFSPEDLESAAQKILNAPTAALSPPSGVQGET